MACLLSSGYANDRQIKGLFNYILQTGDAVRFNDFIDGVTERSPKHKESLMTIAERLRQEGFQKGIRTNALNIAKTMLMLPANAAFAKMYSKRKTIISITHDFSLSFLNWSIRVMLIPPPLFF